jgi:hypothetical protein
VHGTEIQQLQKRHANEVGKLNKTVSTLTVALGKGAVTIEILKADVDHANAIKRKAQQRSRGRQKKADALGKRLSYVCTQLKACKTRLQSLNKRVREDSATMTREERYAQRIVEENTVAKLQRQQVLLKMAAARAKKCERRVTNERNKAAKIYRGMAKRKDLIKQASIAKDNEKKSLVRLTPFRAQLKLAQERANYLEHVKLLKM